MPSSSARSGPGRSGGTDTSPAQPAHQITKARPFRQQARTVPLQLIEGVRDALSCGDPVEPAAEADERAGGPEDISDAVQQPAPASQRPGVGQVADRLLHQRAQPRLQTVERPLPIAEAVLGAAIPNRCVPVLARLGSGSHNVMVTRRACVAAEAPPGRLWGRSGREFRTRNCPGGDHSLSHRSRTPPDAVAGTAPGQPHLEA
jgi:hypothetical protein